MGPAPTPQLWEVPTLSQTMALVGLDVHAVQTQAAILRPLTGELSRTRLRMAPIEVLGFLSGSADASGVEADHRVRLARAR